MPNPHDLAARGLPFPGTGPVPHIVGIGGTPRPGSSSEAALRYALRHAEYLGATTELIAGPLLDLPHYDSSTEHRTMSAKRLVQSLRRADGVIISTPAYHGGLSGMIKNALDYVEDLRGDERVYLDGRSVGIIVSAYGAQAMGTTIIGVRSIAHALRGWPTPFAAGINAAVSGFDKGRPTTDEVSVQIQTVARQVVQFAAMTLAMAECEDIPATAYAARSLGPTR